MNIRQAIALIRTALGEQPIQVHERSATRVFIDVSPAAVAQVSRVMVEDLGARLQTATGVDTPDAMEVLYHWALDALGCVLTVRARVDRAAPAIESIASFCPAAEWIERELWELLGIRVQGHPDLRHLLLDDDWPEGKYPLRRDYQP